MLLPAPDNFGDNDVLALDKLEEEIGGKVARERHRLWFKSPNRKSGQFEYTVGLFGENFSDLLGGREAMDRWMKTKLVELGDRTPEQALRPGMSEAVLEHLFQFANQMPTGFKDGDQ